MSSKKSSSKGDIKKKLTQGDGQEIASDADVIEERREEEEQIRGSSYSPQVFSNDNNISIVKAIIVGTEFFLEKIAITPVKVLEETIFFLVCLFGFGWALSKWGDPSITQKSVTADLSINIILVILFVVILAMTSRLFYRSTILGYRIKQMFIYFVPVLIIALFGRLFYLGGLWKVWEFIAKLWGYFMGLLDSIIYFVIPQALTLLQ